MHGAAFGQEQEPYENPFTLGPEDAEFWERKRSGEGEARKPAEIFPGITPGGQLSAPKLFAPPAPAPAPSPFPWGVLLFVVGGALLLGGGIIVAPRRRRR